MAIELNHLAHFYAVAKHKSFTGAARTLCIQQPSVSRSVRLLEDALGVPLFERQPRGVELTAVGRQVYERSARLFEEVENIQRIAEDERGVCRGPLRVAAAGLVASRLVPEGIARLLARHPAVWPMVFSAPAAMAAERIASGDFELGLYFYAERLPPSLEKRVLVDVPFRLVVRADRARHRPTLSSFIGSREVEDDTARSFPTLERLRRRIPEAEIRISTNDIEAHLRLVEAGLGVSVLPAFVVRAGLDAGRLSDVLPRERFLFPLLCITRERRVLSRAASALIEALIEHLGAAAPRGKRRRHTKNV
jgi:DNA-binding transcriptional LysR family regulator